MKELGWIDSDQKNPIIKIPLQFMFPPVEALSKELTKLNSNHHYRISYLGPRWQNSVLFHKKYSQGGSYSFEDRRVNKNSSFFQDSMSHNQFYRNQIYYRAFQGMNPTLKDDDSLIFESRFESGNLDCAVKVDSNEYDLFLRIDSNTRGNIYWFNFSIKNAGKKKIKFNICNLTKCNNHYSKGLNPFMQNTQTQEWSQQGFSNVTFKKKKLRYSFLYDKLTLRNFYELSFEVEFKGEEQVRIAYCIPYTYSQMLADVREVQKVAEVGVLGQSLTGVDIPILMIGKHTTEKNKHVVIVTGRVHPGESNGSLEISALIKHLCFSADAKYLRDKLLIVIVPMLNPDGVILGNSRTGATGKDMNRQFRSKNSNLYPEIVAIKNLVNKISQTHTIDMYIDFHGHSGKKNMFTFGPNYNITQSLYYKCRVLPKIISTLTPIFRYYGCTYDIPPDKKTTARAVMLGEMSIPIVYTVQTSLGFYFDSSLGKVLTFDKKKWEQLGTFFAIAIKEYYEDLEQLEEFLSSRKKTKKEDSKTNALQQQKMSEGKKKGSQLKKQDIKIFKLYQDIKELDEKKAKQDKKQEDSDASSDSHNSKQELQKEKMCEFTEMVTECLVQQKKRTVFSVQKEVVPKKSKKVIKTTTSILKNKNNRDDEDDIFSFIEQELRGRDKREDLKSQSLSKRKYLERQLKCQIRRGEVASHQLKRQQKLNSSQPKNNNTNNNHSAASSQLYNSEPDMIFVEQRSNKLNVRMFNFQKVVTDIESLRYLGRKRNNIRAPYSKQKSLSVHHQTSKAPIHSMKKSSKSNHSHNVSSHIPYPSQKLQESPFQDLLEGQAQNGDLKINQKMKYPPSYYKIRYQNIRKRKHDQKVNKAFNQHVQFIRITQITKSNPHGVANQQGKSPQKMIKSERDKSQVGKGQYARIKQFPIL